MEVAEVLKYILMSACSLCCPHMAAFRLIIMLSSVEIAATVQSPPGNNRKRPLFLLSNFLPTVHSFFAHFNKWHGFCHGRM